MLDFDNFREIWSTMKKNKLRTFLTGFAVSWGIFMLIILLAASNGLKNGIISNFSNLSQNRVEVWARRTTKPWEGNRINRQIRFKQQDFDDLKSLFPEIVYQSATIRHSSNIYYGEEYVSGNLQGVYPDHAVINMIALSAGKGRFINPIDIEQRGKVIVISPRMEEVLFRGKSALGEYVKIGNIMCKVVGIYDDTNNNNNAPAYIPFSTAQQLYSGGYGFSSLSFSIVGVNTEADSDAFEERFRTTMSRRHNFDPNDEGAIGMWQAGNDFRTFNTMMNGISLFIWVVGLGTLTAGIVGVSNIMLITVRERTREFGIRKALGATPGSILRLVIIESILITAAFGYIGMVLGIGLTEIINLGMEAAGMNNSSRSSGPGSSPTIFMNPTVDISIALMATAVLVVAGVLAGFFPARKAVKISAIEAMRTE